MAKTLTAKSVDATRPDTLRREIPDGGMPGLYLIVQPKRERDGKELPPVMSWAVRYRFDGRPKKHTIGSYPAYSLKTAREEASRLMRGVSEGKNPAEEKSFRKARKVDSVNDAIDYFLKRHVTVKNRSTTLKERTRLFDKDVRPKWGKRTMRSITRFDVVKLIDDTAERAPIVANRLLALLRKFFSWAVDRDIIDTSPMEKKIDPPGEEKTRDRILSDDEIRIVWLAAGKMGYPFGPMIRLLLLTGQRRSEVAGFEWKELELGGNNQLWVIPPERSKNRKEHFVPLSSLALAEIEKLPKVKPKEDQDPIFLFTTTGRTHVSGYGNAKKSLDKEILSIVKDEAMKRGEDPDRLTPWEPWTFHDLRRTAASGMARLSVAIHVLEAVLNHTSGSIKGVAAVYNRYDYASEKRAALTAWADYVTSITALRK
ncbi:tyrosine-type recombinase/integrase [Rhizobium mongolense]|uniref:Integrase n=2 Tax=Rhizobium mongolense TaxID=57676 RepID=A0ABR6IUD6_9HYPH|nr:site-specific integrase [Rhizobium mongolense]MBB4231521.1 integrase [Rhizobium mongolense]TVZ64107.1 site-specific recombinase XerD [Rhizobium mongolense USDA 1844]